MLGFYEPPNISVANILTRFYMKRKAYLKKYFFRPRMMVWRPSPLEKGKKWKHSMFPVVKTFSTCLRHLNQMQICQEHSLSVRCFQKNALSGRERLKHLPLPPSTVNIPVQTAPLLHPILCNWILFGVELFFLIMPSIIGFFFILNPPSKGAEEAFLDTFLFNYGVPAVTPSVC